VTELAGTLLTSADCVGMRWKDGEVLPPEIAMQCDEIQGSVLLLHCRDRAVVSKFGDVRTLDLEDGDRLRIELGAAPYGNFSIASAGSPSPTVIAIHLTPLDDSERATSDSVAAKAS
jgi:hypothetical protein